MSKKFAKLLVFSAAIGSAIGAVYYFARKKNAEADSTEEDYDDFSEDETDSGDCRCYVPLNPDGQTEDGKDGETAVQEPEVPADETTPSEESPTAKPDGFTPLAEKVAETVENAEETVEKFFDENSAE